MYYIIYETTNNVNGKKYRGAHQTPNIDDGYLGSGKILTYAVKKYGKIGFTRTILEYCNDRKHMLAREMAWVNHAWLLREDTYNLKLGGDGFQSDDVSGNKNSFYGKTHNVAFRKAQSERMSKRLGTLNQFYGKSHTKETVDKIRNTCRASASYGDANPARRPENRAKISASLSGKMKSNEHRKALSESKIRTYVATSPQGSKCEMLKSEIKSFCSSHTLHYYSFLKFVNKGVITDSILNARMSKHYHTLANTVGWSLVYKEKAG